MRYDHNLLNLQAEGLESVELERKLLEECNQSVWYAVSIADSREELLARKEQLLKMGSVERTEEIVSLLPVDHERRRPIIERIQAKLGQLPERPPLIPVDRPEELGQMFAYAQQLLVQFQQPAAARTFEQIRDTLRRLAAADCSVAALAVSATDGRRLAESLAHFANDGESRAAATHRLARELGAPLRRHEQSASAQDLRPRQHLGHGRADRASSATCAPSIRARPAIRCRHTKRRSR